MNIVLRCPSFLFGSGQTNAHYCTIYSLYSGGQEKRRVTFFNGTFIFSVWFDSACATSSVVFHITCWLLVTTMISKLMSSIFNITVEGARPPEPYYGREIGSFTDFAHGIKVSIGTKDDLTEARLWYYTVGCDLMWLHFPQGQVYAVDESTIFIKGFAYDGTGPDAFFWVGKTPRPSPDGYIIPYPEEYNGR